jgi:hypothetical protein
VQRGEALTDDLVGAAALGIDDEGDTARVVLVRGVVQALGRRDSGVRHVTGSFVVREHP